MKLHKIAAALALSALALGSQAVPLIASFNAATSGGFIFPTATCAASGVNGTTTTPDSQANCQASLNFTGLNGVVPTAFPANTPGFIQTALAGFPFGLGGLPTYNSVAWGTAATANGQSSLDVTHLAAANGPVITDGGWVVIDKFQHHNNLITPEGGFMNSVAFYGQFDLAANLPFAGLAVPGINSIGLNETLNVGPCAPPNPNGSTCDDLFVTQPLEGTFQFYTDGNGTPYFIQFRFDNGSGGVVIPDGGNVDIYTAEGVTSFVTTSVRIFTVPEPGMLALFGFGLVGVALSRRRKVSV